MICFRSLNRRVFVSGHFKWKRKRNYLKCNGCTAVTLIRWTTKKRRSDIQKPRENTNTTKHCIKYSKNNKNQQTRNSNSSCSMPNAQRYATTTKSKLEFIFSFTQFDSTSSPFNVAFYMKPSWAKLNWHWHTMRSAYGFIFSLFFWNDLTKMRRIDSVAFLHSQSNAILYSCWACNVWKGNDPTAAI